MGTSQKKKIAALAKYLEINPSDIEVTDFGLFRRTDGVSGEYYVYTEREANKAAKEKIRNELWAFNINFLMRYIKAFKELNDYEWERVEKAIHEMQTSLCETANEIIYAMVGGKKFKELAEDAISEDGRGHFLSGYDGIEYEISGTPYYAYCEDR